MLGREMSGVPSGSPGALRRPDVEFVRRGRCGPAVDGPLAPGVLSVVALLLAPMPSEELGFDTMRARAALASVGLAKLETGSSSDAACRGGDEERTAFFGEGAKATLLPAVLEPLASLLPASSRGASRWPKPMPRPSTPCRFTAAASASLPPLASLGGSGGERAELWLSGVAAGGALGLGCPAAATRGDAASSAWACVD